MALSTFHQFLPLFLFCLLFSFISSQNCDNPLGKYLEISLVSFQNIPEADYCTEIVSKSCCLDSYLNEGQTELDLLKADHDVFGDTLYQEIVDLEDSFWTLVDDAAYYFPEYFDELESYELDSIQDTFTEELFDLQLERQVCFESLWEHTAALYCLACSYSYSDYAEYDETNDIVTLSMNYTVCSNLQNACHLYAETFDYWVQYSEAIDFTARALYAFAEDGDYSFKAVYTDVEKTNIDIFEANFTNLKCLSNAVSCFDFCDQSLTASGFNSSQLEPTNHHFNWAVEQVETLHTFLKNNGIIYTSSSDQEDEETCSGSDCTSEDRVLIVKNNNATAESFGDVVSNYKFFPGLLKWDKSTRLGLNETQKRKLQSVESEFQMDYSLGFKLDTIEQGNLTAMDWSDKIAKGALLTLTLALFICSFALIA